MPLGTYAKSLEYYSTTKINVNMHRSIQDQTLNRNSLLLEAHSVNNRTFEIANSCAFQLTDFRSNLAQHYTPKLEIETFQSPAEFIMKAEYYLTHETERLQIATNAYKRTLREHTYDQRVHLMLKHLFISKGGKYDAES